MQKLNLKLPAFAEKVIYEYQYPLNPDTPEDVMMMSLLMELSKMMCFKRIKIEHKTVSVFPNIYSFNFLPSGAGKDYTNTVMRRACKVTTKIMKEKLAEYPAKKRKELEDEVNSSESFKNGELGNKKTLEIEDAKEDGACNKEETLVSNKWR